MCDNHRRPIVALLLIGATLAVYGQVAWPGASVAALFALHPLHVQSGVYPGTIG